MPMLMLKCKNCGEVFPGVYIPEDTEKVSKLNANSATSHECSRGTKTNIHMMIIWTGPDLKHSEK